MITVNFHEIIYHVLLASFWIFLLLHHYNNCKLIEIKGHLVCYSLMSIQFLSIDKHKIKACSAYKEIEIK